MVNDRPWKLLVILLAITSSLIPPLLSLHTEQLESRYLISTPASQGKLLPLSFIYLIDKARGNHVYQAYLEKMKKP